MNRVNGRDYSGSTTCKSYVPASLDSVVPHDEKRCDNRGRYPSSLKGVGSTIAVPVVKRVEAVCDVVVDYSSSPMTDAVQLPPRDAEHF